jgi:hypothetical protein
MANAALKLFIPFTKVDEERREVAGRLTQEMVDRDREVMDFETSRPYFEAWSDWFGKATDGKSLGNLRVMHRKDIAAGHLTNITFDDDDRAIDIVAHVDDDAEWAKCVAGTYTGFSAGGSVVRKWNEPGQPGVKRFTANPTEASLADFPAVPTATFTLVKVGGATEERHFAKVAARTDVDAKEGKDKYGDVEFADPTNHRYPINTAAHVRAAWSYINMPKNSAKYSAEDLASVKGKIRAAAKKFGVEVAEDSGKTASAGDFAKSMYDVGDLANSLQNLVNIRDRAVSEALWEQDGSGMAAMLDENIKNLTVALKAMVDEETAELLQLTELEERIMGTNDSGKTATGTGEAFAKIAAGLKKAAGHAAKMHEAIGKLHEKVGELHKAAGEHSEHMAGMCDGEGAEKVFSGLLGDDSFAKAAGEIAALKEQLAKVTGERDEFQKTANELAAAGQALLEQRRPALRVVGKDTDDGSGGEAVGKTAGAAAGGDPLDKVIADDKASPDDRATAAFKKSFQRPTIVNMDVATAAAAGKK